MFSTFVILGIHGEDVATVPDNVARVRMYVNGKEIDEDFLLPTLKRAFPPTLEVYQALLEETIERRMKELEEAKNE